MREVLKIVLMIFFLNLGLAAQSITGKLVDQFGNGFTGLQLELYISQKVYTASSTADGTFSFANITSVEKEVLPTGYSVSQNYPNPFNPKTRIDFSFPERSNVKVSIYNSIGQCVKSIEEKSFSAGANHMDLELNGLSNGVYIARITINEKYSTIKKLMLLYGSRHLIGRSLAAEPVADKITAAIKIDSLVVMGTNVYKTTFIDFPLLQGSTLNLGIISIPHPCPGTPIVTYAGQVYNTVQIGAQCWLKENLNVGETVTGNQDQTNNGKIEKYCYNNDPANCTKYGGLYQWAEAVQYKNGATNSISPNPAFTGNVQGICPQGWHIPTRDEFVTLQISVKYSNSALIAQGQLTGNDTHGFSALLAGIRNGFDGTFIDLGNSTAYWSSSESEYYSNLACMIYLYYRNQDSYLANYNKPLGFSVRCTKD